jgi:hypothetical protein
LAGSLADPVAGNKETNAAKAMQPTFRIIMQELLADTYSAKPDDGKDQPARATLPLETIVRACRLQCQAFPPSTTS